MTMVITNLTSQDYWFGPLHLPGGNGQTLQVDDTSATSLYLTDDSVADAINYLFAASPAKITVVPTTGTLFPRPTGKPDVLHGDGSPEGLVYASEGTLFLRRDNANVYQKRSMVHVTTGWTSLGQGDRDQQKKLGLGYTGETFSKDLIASSFAFTTGDCRATPLGLLAGDVITNVILDITVNIQTVTKFQIGLYNSAGNTLLASTANSTSNQNSGLNSYALSAPYTVPADGLYYLAVIVAATTMGSIGATAFGQNKGQGIGSNPKGSIVLASQSGLPAALGSSTWDQDIWFGWN